MEENITYMEETSFWNSNTREWMTAGGTVGAVILSVFYYVIQSIRNWLSKQPKLIKIYYAITKQNFGQENESEGQLLHHWGKKSEDYICRCWFCSKTIEVWEWSSSNVGRPHTGKESVLHGPYSSDCSEPGYYKAIFWIKGINTGKIPEDPILFKLDVNHLVVENLLIVDPRTQTPQIVDPKLHTSIVNQYVRKSDLFENKWTPFELTFYSKGNGTWEYRVFPFNRVHNEIRDNLKVLETLPEPKPRILFWKVEIFKLRD
jgi:hypothetical protein